MYMYVNHMKLTREFLTPEHQTVAMCFSVCRMRVTSGKRGICSCKLTSIRIKQLLLKTIDDFIFDNVVFE